MSQIKKCVGCSAVLDDVFSNKHVSGSEYYCYNCFNVVSKDKTMFVSHVPSFCSGFDVNFYFFNDFKNIVGKICELEDDEILMKSDYHILRAKKDMSRWFVIGIVENYDMELVDLPLFK